MENGACQPSWSPNGAQLVFISPCLKRGEFYEDSYADASLYMVNVDGTELKQLTTAPGPDYDPAWAPDGKRIAFTSMRDGRKEIYILTIESGVVTRLTNSKGDIENMQPSWSPFGNQIAYTVKRFGAYQVWVMSDTGQSNVQIARSGPQLWDYLPVWGPDGETLLFNQRDLGPTRPWLLTIRYEDRESKSPTQLADFPKPIENVEFSLDGLWLVYESLDNDFNRDIYFMTISGGDRTRLTTDPAVEFDPVWRPIK